MDESTLGEYLVFFAKFEFKLKEYNFIKFHNKKKRTVGANWICFSKSLSIEFYKEIKDQKDFSEIFRNGGPKVLVKNKELEYENSDPITDNKTLIIACMNIRNNSVHGGKLQTKREAVNRNHELLRCAKSILIEAISYCPRIHENEQTDIMHYLNSPDL